MSKDEDDMITDWIQLVQIAASDLPLKKKTAILKKSGWVKTFKTDFNKLSDGVGP